MISHSGCYSWRHRPLGALTPVATPVISHLNQPAILLTKAYLFGRQVTDCVVFTVRHSRISFASSSFPSQARAINFGSGL